MNDRSGSATLLLLLLSAGLMLVATATWRVTRASYTDAVSSGDALQARLAAEAGIARIVRSGRILPTIGLGISSALGGSVLVAGVNGARADLKIVRLSRELYRVDAIGSAGLPVALAPLGFLLWSLDPGARVGALGVVSRVGGAVWIAPGGSLVGDSVSRPPPPWSANTCLPVQARADSLYPFGTAGASAPDTTAALGLGLLGRAELLGRGRAVIGTGTPGPTTGAGGCDPSDPWNWGSPASPAGPCGGYRPAITSLGDLVVSGGEGQGLLAVDGNLHLTAGARFYGVVLTSGDLTVDRGARIDGFVRTGGSLSVGPLGQVSGSACSALLALGNPILRAQVAVPAGWIDPL